MERDRCDWFLKCYRCVFFMKFHVYALACLMTAVIYSSRATTSALGSPPSVEPGPWCNMKAVFIGDVIFIKFSSLYTLKVFKMTISVASSDENILKMKTFFFQCSRNGNAHYETALSLHWECWYWLDYVFILKEPHGPVSKHCPKSREVSKQ